MDEKVVIDDFFALSKELKKVKKEESDDDAK